MNSHLPQLGEDGRILEGIVTTYSADGTVNISPMGPIVDESITRFRFRPYQTSNTYQNLKRTGSGIFHITDDVLLFAQAAIGTPDPHPELEGLRLQQACRWFKFQVSSLDDSQQRTHIVAETIEHGQNRDFLGFNRAKHAVLEAAILATRIHILPNDQILAELERLATPVHKTASAVEQQAFDYLADYIHRETQRLTTVETQQ
jgi:hypothetical protein